MTTCKVISRACLFTAERQDGPHNGTTVTGLPWPVGSYLLHCVEAPDGVKTAERVCSKAELEALYEPFHDELPAAPDACEGRQVDITVPPGCVVCETCRGDFTSVVGGGWCGGCCNTGVHAAPAPPPCPTDPPAAGDEGHEEHSDVGAQEEDKVDPPIEPAPPERREPHRIPH